MSNLWSSPPVPQNWPHNACARAALARRPSPPPTSTAASHRPTPPGIANDQAAMPTVPPTFVAHDSGDLFLPPCPLADPTDTMGSPTPDPDDDEGVLVSVVTGDGMGAITSVSRLRVLMQQRRRILMPLSLSCMSTWSLSATTS